MEKLNFQKNFQNSHSKISNKRQLLLKDFFDILVKERDPKYKPLNPKVLGIRLSRFSFQQLSELFSNCKSAENFSALFWYKLKQK